ncbi:MATE family efflux transporter [Natronoglycomyces albus]|uniref:MATE family efflux transporter n=1 Tax=Natronoglycomyces albus TaxID=2811108 RepID=A0A895XKI5_9ACTN|nr:MATE family efflux transporter [Natronoglycomyces albus]QSB06251.1 MATE family efflux transporter [Natronoglycomyces albus]
MTLTPQPPTVRSSAASFTQITALALPALVVLAAEPIFLLIDTAVVGHLGAVPLAALAIGAIMLAVAGWVGAVLAYGTTARAARKFGSGDRAAAVAEGVQGTWLALGASFILFAIVQAAAGPIASAFTGDPEVAQAAALWMRIAAFGLPSLLLISAGQGWMRGVQDTKTPMRFVLIAFLVAAILTPTLVYPVGLGLPGSAIANVVAQTIAGVLFLRALRRENVNLRPQVWLLRKQLIANRDLLVRGLAMQACFLSAAAVAGHVSTASLAAHQIGLQLWMFASLALDAVAIAGQALIGAQLGARSRNGAIATAKKLTWIGLAYGGIFLALMLALSPVLPYAFSSDPAVWVQMNHIFLWMIVLMPVAGVVFALDGVLIGAGDLAFMRNMTVAAAVFGWLPFTWATPAFGWGLFGIWAGLAAFMVIRLVLILLRLRGGHWAVVGAQRA